MKFNQALAEQKLKEIASKYFINAEILRNIIFGKSQGWSQTKIAQSYSINPNTISKYTRILEREMNTEEIKQLLLIVGLIVGASYLLKEFFK